jgi:putative membrane protein
MKRFLVKILINAAAFWLMTKVIELFSGSTENVYIYSWDEGSVGAYIGTLLIVAVIFGLVNGIIGNFIRIVAFPLYILTLGLLALVVNSLLLLLVSWISTQIGFGLYVESFWWGVLAAVLLSIIAAILGAILRPLTGDTKRKRR